MDLMSWINRTILSLFVLLSNYGFSGDNYQEKQIEVALRMIGHQLLLEDGDSTSRILPIEKDEDQYKIKFDTEFSFMGENLVNIVDRVFLFQGIEGGYIMEVVSCSTGEVVYSYQKEAVASENLIPCQSRNQVKDCYEIVINLSPDPEMAMIKPQEKKSGAYTLVIILVILIVVGTLVFWKRRNGKEDIQAHLIRLGDYLFDQRNATLIYQNQRKELTGKESELLILLYNSVNDTVKREVILNEVWGDEGDYVGRTLDVFISKLRKKLEEDSKIKITNIRGVGYKLIVNV